MPENVCVYASMYVSKLNDLLSGHNIITPKFEVGKKKGVNCIHIHTYVLECEKVRKN